LIAHGFLQPGGIEAASHQAYHADPESTCAIMRR
jgi:hypothetical protein